MKRARVLVSWFVSYRAIWYLLATVSFFVTISRSEASPPGLAAHVEVFVSSDSKVIVQRAIRTNGKQKEIVDLQVYDLDVIRFVEVALSVDLPANPDQSKLLVLRRIQAMDEQARGRMKKSAVGLARAMQYGINRFPAIVFDSQAVVYGVTDIQAALSRYRAWRAEGAL